MNRYKKLMSNTMIFAIGTFSSKLLVFFMTRFYTAVLTKTDFSIANLITQAANVMIPIASIGITQSIIRFGLDNNYSKHRVFTIGLAVLIAGSVILLPFMPVIGLYDDLKPHLVLIYIYVLSANLQSLCGQFTRARGHVKLYALDGICRTLTTILFNVIFLRFFGWGLNGYVWSVICSNLLSVLCIFFIDNQYRFLHIRALSPGTALPMLRYAIPLIPSTLCVLIVAASDQFFVNHICGEEANAVYAVAYKIPTILIILSGIFIEAWQISTIKDSGDNRRELENFFSRVGNVYQALLFMLASGIIMTAKLTTSIIAAPSYYEAWRFIPLLIFGSTFACLSNFQNSIYTLEKKSTASLATSFIGAVLNLALNATLIPWLGGNGAAFATLASYITIFMIRAIHTRRYLRVRWNVPRFAASFVLLCMQSALMLHDGPYWITQQLAFFILISFIGFKDILIGVKKVLQRS